MLKLRGNLLLVFVCVLAGFTLSVDQADGFQFQQVPINSVQQAYVKQSVQIPMRDGTKLFTTIYAPRDTSKPYPIMLNRTPYSVRPYDAQYPGRIGPSKYMENEGYIFVKQDVRGRWMLSLIHI